MLVKNKNLNCTIEGVGKDALLSIKTTVIVDTKTYYEEAWGALFPVEEGIEGGYTLEITLDELLEDHFVDEMDEIQREHPEFEFWTDNGDGDWTDYKEFTEEKISKFLDLLYEKCEDKKRYSNKLQEHIDELAQETWEDSRPEPDYDDYEERMEERYYDLLDKYDL